MCYRLMNFLLSLIKENIDFHHLCVSEGGWPKKFRISELIAQRIKKFTYRATFSNSGNLSKKVSITKCYRVIYFFLEVRKLKIFRKRSSMFLFSCVHLLFSNCMFAMLINNLFFFFILMGIYPCIFEFFAARLICANNYCLPAVVLLDVFTSN